MITLQQQIMLTEGRIKAREQRDSDAPLDDAILASLRRLQDIEQQEPVSWQFYQNDQWSHGSEYHNHRENTEQGGIPVRDLYALPVSTEGYKLVPIEPTREMLENGNSELAYDCGSGTAEEVYRAMLAAVDK